VKEVPFKENKTEILYNPDMAHFITNNFHILLQIIENKNLIFNKNDDKCDWDYFNIKAENIIMESISFPRFVFVNNKTSDIDVHRIVFQLMIS